MNGEDPLDALAHLYAPENAGRDTLCLQSMR